MPSTQDRQSTDRTNSQGFGTTKLSEDQGNYLKANKVQDGNASGKGRKVPPRKNGVR